MPLHPSRSKSLVQEETVHLDLTTGKMLNLVVNLLQRACISLFYHFCPCLLYTSQLLPRTFLPPCDTGRREDRLCSHAGRLLGRLVERRSDKLEHAEREKYRNRTVAGRRSGRKPQTCWGWKESDLGNWRGFSSSTLPSSQALVNSPCNYAPYFWHLEVFKFVADRHNF